MTLFGKLAFSAITIGLMTSAASAMPVFRPVDAGNNLHVQIRNGYGPVHNGLYGSHRGHRNVANGTGYRGRGTRTGGPAGGLPGRS